MRARIRYEVADALLCLAQVRHAAGALSSARIVSSELEHDRGVELHGADIPRPARAARGVPLGGGRADEGRPATPEGRVNVTDPVSHVVNGLRGDLQGYNAQAVTSEHQIVLAAEIETVGAGFGHLEPMLDATQRELAEPGVDELPEVVPADAGYGQAQLGRRPLRRDAGSAGHRPRERAFTASASR